FIRAIDAGDALAYQRALLCGGPSIFSIVVCHGSGSFRFRRLQHGGAHSGISSATAEVSAQAVLNLLRRGIGMLIEKCLGGHNKTRRAEATLLRVIVNECLLDGMQMTRF